METFKFWFPVDVSLGLQRASAQGSTLEIFSYRISLMSNTSLTFPLCQ